jgi:hypothetical protein
VQKGETNGRREQQDEDRVGPHGVGEVLAGVRLVRRRLQVLEVESYTQLPGELAQAPVCRSCVLTGEQWLKQWLECRAWELRELADRLERACEEGIEVSSLGDLHNLQRRRRVGRVRTDLSGSDES